MSAKEGIRHRRLRRRSLTVGVAAMVGMVSAALVAAVFMGGSSTQAAGPAGQGELER